MDESGQVPRHASEGGHDDAAPAAKPRRLYVDDEPSRTSDTLWRRDTGQTPASPDEPRELGDDDATTDPDVSAPDAATGRPADASSAAKPKQRRERLTPALLYTLLSALLPGLGLIGAKQRAARFAGMIVAGGSVVAVVLALVWFNARVHPDPGESWLHAAATAAVGIAVGRGALHILTVLVLALGLVWVALIAATNLATRPRRLGQAKRMVCAVLVGALSLVVGTPIAVGANYAQVLASTLGSTFSKQGEVVSDTNPTIEAPGPSAFGDLERLNVLLLGSDLDERRLEQARRQGFGLRTDTIMLASIDTRTGETAIIQIPRNVQRTPFPPASQMARAFPEGFTGPGDPGEWYVNTIWERVERDHPELYAGQTFPGAEALKAGVQGITGLEVHYFVMLNLDGLRNLIDAMGGVTVNINERLPIGGTSKNPGSTTGWLEIGPDQHLDGSHALWYARSRWSTSDYSRMERQSCLVKAITDQANPTTLLTRFEAIAGASSDMVRTDIPAEALEAVTDLALKVPNQPMRRLVFANGQNGYDYADPDFDTMRAHVRDLIDPPTPTPTPSAEASPTPSVSESPEPSPSPSESTDGAQDIADACAFNPADEEE